MPELLDIASDAGGLRIAAEEMLEATFLKEFNEVIRERTQGQAKPAEIPCTVSSGYYARVRHLFELESMLNMDALPRFNPQAGELSGLRALAAARDAFRVKHPPCPHCGAPLEGPGAFTCWKCRAKVKE